MGTGFRIVGTDAPSRILISIKNKHIPFNYRILGRSDSKLSEITLWALCIEGLWDGIPYERTPEIMGDNTTVKIQFESSILSYKRRWRFFCERMFYRLNPGARKQFLRLSTPVMTEWPGAPLGLESFAKDWLEPN